MSSRPLFIKISFSSTYLYSTLYRDQIYVETINSVECKPELTILAIVKLWTKIFIDGHLANILNNNIDDNRWIQKNLKKNLFTIARLLFFYISQNEIIFRLFLIFKLIIDYFSFIPFFFVIKNRDSWDEHPKFNISRSIKVFLMHDDYRYL